MFYSCLAQPPPAWTLLASVRLPIRQVIRGWGLKVRETEAGGRTKGFADADRRCEAFAEKAWKGSCV